MPKTQNWQPQSVFWPQKPYEAGKWSHFWPTVKKLWYNQISFNTYVKIQRLLSRTGPSFEIVISQQIIDEMSQNFMRIYFEISFISPLIFVRIRALFTLETIWQKNIVPHLCVNKTFKVHIRYDFTKKLQKSNFEFKCA